MIEIKSHVRNKVHRIEADTLEYVNLDSRDLHRFDLRGAKMRGASFRNANLRNAEFENADLSEANFAYANMANAELDRACLIGAKLQHAELSGARFVGAVLDNADLSYANILVTNFQGASLKGVVLTGATYFERHTIWPEGFDPQAHGATLVQFSTMTDATGGDREGNVRKFRAINCIHQDSLAALRERLQREGWRIFELDGETITDRSSFFQKAGEQLPHDPELDAGSTWDGFNDSLFGGLADLKENQIAIVWTKAHRMLEGGLPDLLLAQDIFQDIARDLTMMTRGRDFAQGKIGSPAPPQLVVFLVGDGNNFKPL